MAKHHWKEYELDIWIVNKIKGKTSVNSIGYHWQLLPEVEFLVSCSSVLPLYFILVAIECNHGVCFCPLLPWIDVSSTYANAGRPRPKALHNLHPSSLWLILYLPRFSVCTFYHACVPFPCFFHISPVIIPLVFLLNSLTQLDYCDYCVLCKIWQNHMIGDLNIHICCISIILSTEIMLQNSHLTKKAFHLVLINSLFLISVLCCPTCISDHFFITFCMELACHHFSYCIINSSKHINDTSHELGF